METCPAPGAGGGVGAGCAAVPPLGDAGCDEGLAAAGKATKAAAFSRTIAAESTANDVGAGLASTGAATVGRAAIIKAAGALVAAAPSGRATTVAG
jgi:hypothetical protein